jgi:hypothetical protein
MTETYYVYYVVRSEWNVAIEASSPTEARVKFWKEHDDRYGRDFANDAAQDDEPRIHIVGVALEGAVEINDAMARDDIRTLRIGDATLNRLCDTVGGCRDKRVWYLTEQQFAEVDRRRGERGGR